MSVRHRTDPRTGKRRVWVDVYLADGTRRQGWYPGTITEAKAWERQQRHERDRAGWGLGGKGQTFGDLVPQFLRAVEHEGWSEGYLRELRRPLAGDMTERWGELPVTKISPAKVYEWMADRAQQPTRTGAPPKSATLNKERRALCAFFTWALRMGKVTASPMPGVKPPKVRQRAMRWLTPAEFARLYQAAPDYLQPILLVLTATGMRAGELCALRPTWLRGGALYVIGKGDRERRVPCPSPLGMLLRRKAGKRKGPVFQRPTIYKGLAKQTDDWTPDALRRAVKSAAKAAGLVGVLGPHVLRHTATTWMVAADVPLRRVQKILGHATVLTTEKYEHDGHDLDWQAGLAKLPRAAFTIFSLHGPQQGATRGTKRHQKQRPRNNSNRVHSA